MTTTVVTTKQEARSLLKGEKVVVPMLTPHDVRYVPTTHQTVYEALSAGLIAEFRNYGPGHYLQVDWVDESEL